MREERGRQREQEVEVKLHEQRKVMSEEIMTKENTKKKKRLNCPDEKEEH